MNYALFKIVLSSLTGDFSVVDGMLRAVVIAGQTAGTRIIVLPSRQSIYQTYIACRTNFFTFSAMDTYVSIDSEFAIGNHMSIEVCTYHM